MRIAATESETADIMLYFAHVMPAAESLGKATDTPPEWEALPSTGRARKSMRCANG